MWAAFALALGARLVRGTTPAGIAGEHRCDHDLIGIVTAAERATELAFEDRFESRLDGEVLDQVQPEARPAARRCVC